MKYWKAAALAVGLSLAFVPPAQADDNEALYELLKALHKNGTIDDATYQAIRRVAEKGDQEGKTQTREVVQKEVKRQVAEQVEQQTAKANAEQPKIDTDGKLQITSADGDFSARVGGRIQADAAAYDDDQADLGSGTEIRRARLFMSGVLWRDWAYKLQYDFTDSGADGIADAYISYIGFDPVSLKVGHFKEPFSLENITSSKHVTFIERALPEVFRPGRSIGGQVATHGSNWSAAAGFFGEGAGSSPRNVPASSSTNEVDEGYGMTGRVTWVPVYSDNTLVHLGAAGSYRKMDQTDSFRLRQRPESHVTNVRLVDTGSFAADDFALMGLETAILYDSFHVQSEYMRMDVDRPGVNPDATFDGYYAEAGYFLTGERKNYDVSDGSFGRVKPNSVVGRGGIGAWQLATRLSSLDLSDTNITGGEEENWTLGVNWWPTANLRFSANYVQVLSVDGGPNAGDEPSAFTIRSQVEF